MKVLLIYPPVTCVGSGLVVTSHAPMGLMYLSSYIRQVGHEVKLLDALADGKDKVIKTRNGVRLGMTWSQIKKNIDKFGPEVVGLSVMFTAYYEDALDLAKKIKKHYPKVKIVFGGSHVSTNPWLSMKDKVIDYIVYGEGELTFEKLLKTLESKKKDFSKIYGLAYRLKRKTVVNRPAELIKDLDILPFPDWNMLNLKNYELGDESQVMRKPCFSVETSRGCPNHCMYCSSFAVWRHQWRGRSPKNVLDEIENLVRNFGAREIAFYDDSMSVDRKRMVEICKGIIKRKLDIKWTPPNGIAHWTLDKELLVLMKKSGCYKITFGIESGDPETRRWVGKPYDLNQAKELTKFANDIGYWTLATNIIGFPYETRGQIRKTLDYAIDSGVDTALFFRLGLRPGAPVYGIFEKEGWLPKDKKVLFTENLSLDTKYIKGSELVELQQRMYEEFMRKRWGSISVVVKLLKKIRSIEDMFYTLKQMKYIYDFRSGWVGRRSGVISKRV
ncbi:MAG TPA: radical SAM protein [Candidatus Methanoperedens sp.]|nr:radical SAM protein [Candidatus Methanoperedens sp.]